jgi:hypothetical protein
MKSVVKINGTCVVKGLSIQEYLELIEGSILYGMMHKGFTEASFKTIANYSELRDFLDDFMEYVSVWDFPAEDLDLRAETDEGDYLYVEIFDGDEPRYFETFIPLEDVNLKEVL